MTVLPLLHNALTMCDMIRPQDPISFIANFMLMNKGTTRKIEDVIKEIPKEMREENQAEEGEEEEVNEEEQEEEKKEEVKEEVKENDSRPGTNNSKKIVKS